MNKVNRFKSFAKHYPLPLFFALAFGIAWLAKPFALTDGDLTNISLFTTGTTPGSHDRAVQLSRGCPG